MVRVARRRRRPAFEIEGLADRGDAVAVVPRAPAERPVATGDRPRTEAEPSDGEVGITDQTRPHAGHTRTTQPARYDGRPQSLSAAGLSSTAPVRGSHRTTVSVR